MSRDLTIETVLADPMIRAVMRADRVEPLAFEQLLRTTAKQVDATARPVDATAKQVDGWAARSGLAPANLVAQQARAPLRGFCCV